MGRICPNCGSESNGGKFCTKCGHQFEGAEQGQATNSEKHSWTSCFRNSKVNAPKWTMNNNDETNVPDEYKPLSVLGYIALSFLFSLCCVGFFIALYFALDGVNNKNARNYARFYVVSVLLVIVLYVIFGIIFAALFGSFFDLLRYRYY